MTVSSQVKGCFASLKNVEATLETLTAKTTNQETEQVFREVRNAVKIVKNDLEEQVIFLTKEEPQYKS
ncbi:DUF1657 domain-containing protein [Lentibacillus cibarius]|uniref:DUF1657 domain-containing protein n=1 Tax=Lentibacillus cibarius TaxID=2583219 RepID=A0A549YK11_9BACI|nr:DUF1657 domain-containing protein [Lentibacillus cibarius]TMN23409.1 DUF1657 domain-containing protein [Lentibacillus cibarius]TRM12220.1 DUF1657 domain-containing protein [Lentibacillus cibarius]